MDNSKPKIRLRSPRYPSHSLDEAIEYVSRIYVGVHRSPIDPDTAYKLMGFAGKSGASATALGSIRQYGLIEGSGDNTKVSNLALSILEPESLYEKAQSIERAAFEPAVFNSTRDRFGGKIPPSDEPIRAYLIRELGFSKSGVDDCIRALRGTISLLPQVLDADNLEEEKDVEVNSPEDEPTTTSLESAPLASGPNSQYFRIPVSRECVAEITFKGALSAEAIERLIQHIQLMGDVWAED